MGPKLNFAKYDVTNWFRGHDNEFSVFQWLPKSSGLSPLLGA